MPTPVPIQALDGARITAAVGLLARQVLARNPKARGLVLVGIRTRGLPLARRIAQRIEQSAGAKVPVGVLDITLYRDDFSTVGAHPLLRRTEIPFPITGRRMVLVDDVLYTGRTARAALDALVDFGRPKVIQLAVLVDRGHRELPIHADFVGHTLDTREDDFVQVQLKEEDGADAVLLGARPKGRRRAFKG